MAAVQHSPNGSTTDSNYAASPSNPLPSSAQADRTREGVHTRTYQACIPCRTRKVKCDLGSVDNPHDPPCMRCRRESKECFFSNTRRKKRNPEDADIGTVTPPTQGRKKLRADEDVEESVERPRTPGGSIARTQPLRRPAPNRPQFDEEQIRQSERTAGGLLSIETYNGHDALKLLSVLAAEKTRGSVSSTGRPDLGVATGDLPPATSPIMTSRRSDNAIPGFSPDSIPTDLPGYALAYQAWSRFRFVRSGWFTAKEGIAYVLYFYKYLSPLTPVTLPDFQPLDTHEKLLTQEPMLAITVLLIASRHMKLEGPGSLTRPYTIHSKLWDYLQGMVNRVVWGQEQYGGGLAAAGSLPGSDVNPLSRKGLRTLGTVESFILITEWHPRAMHFPPDEADVELMAPDTSNPTADADSSEQGNHGIGGQRMDSWLEPCWRSDRLCWMLLGLAMSLAFEIGVFDKSEWQRHALSPDGQPLSAMELQKYDIRRSNLRDCLLIYVTLTSGRLGLTTMLPGNYSKPEDSVLYRSFGQHDSVQEAVLHFWLRIAAIIREGNKRIFANKGYTRDLIKNGTYKEALETLRGPLQGWRADFDDCKAIPKFMRYILLIEYEYCRVYLFALALQAVAQRCANDIPQVNDPPMDVSREDITTKGIHTDVAIAPQTLAKWLGGDRRYINEVREGACNLLSAVVDGLYPGEYLKHAPVRSYFRIICVAIMLLKSFSLGAMESDIADSLNLLSRTVEALRTCIVDDVHVASRFADLLDVLIQSIKPRLVRISAGNGRSRKQSHRSTPISGQDVSDNIGQPLQQQQTQQTQGAQPASMLNQQWTASNNIGRDPMSGISDNIYDLTGTREHSIMPPPTFTNAVDPLLAAGNGAAQPGAAQPGAAQVSATQSAYEGMSYGNGIDLFNADMQDWFTLPLDPLINLSGADVNQTMYGPELGGQDMLEVLLSNNAANGNAYSGSNAANLGNGYQRSNVANVGYQASNMANVGNMVNANNIANANMASVNNGLQRNLGNNVNNGYQ